MVSSALAAGMARDRIRAGLAASVCAAPLRLRQPPSLGHPVGQAEDG